MSASHANHTHEPPSSTGVATGNWFESVRIVGAVFLAAVLVLLTACASSIDSNERVAITEWTSLAAADVGEVLDFCSNVITSDVQSEAFINGLRAQYDLSVEDAQLVMAKLEGRCASLAGD